MAERKNQATKKTDEAKKETIKRFEWSIDRAKEFDDGNITFDATVNEVKLFGLSIRKGENGDFIGYPSRKGNNGKYYKYSYLPLDDKQLDEFIQGVYDKLDAEA